MNWSYFMKTLRKAQDSERNLTGMNIELNKQEVFLNLEASMQQPKHLLKPILMKKKQQRKLKF